MTHSVFSARSMAQLVSESVILWQRIVEGGSCFLPPPHRPAGPSWGERHHTKQRGEFLKTHHVSDEKSQEKTVTRLYHPRISGDQDSLRTESLCVCKTHIAEKLGPTPEKHWVASVNCTVNTPGKLSWVSWRMFSQDRVQSFIFFSSIRFRDPAGKCQKTNISSFHGRVVPDPSS